MVRAMDEVIRRMPVDLEQAARPSARPSWKWPCGSRRAKCFPVLSLPSFWLSDADRDAASVLFTAGYTDRIPTSLMEPTASLPLAVFFQLGTPYPIVQQRVTPRL